jgi:hypothetical protein
MSTRKRKQDEELVALPSDESEEEEECVHLPYPSHHHRTAAHQQGFNCHLYSSRARRSASMRRVADAAASLRPERLPSS